MDLLAFESCDACFDLSRGLDFRLNHYLASLLASDLAPGVIGRAFAS